MDCLVVTGSYWHLLFKCNFMKPNETCKPVENIWIFKKSLLHYFCLCHSKVVITIIYLTPILNIKMSVVTHFFSTKKIIVMWTINGRYPIFPTIFQKTQTKFCKSTFLGLNSNCLWTATSGFPCFTNPNLFVELIHNTCSPF